eukprot:TRINITY_DN4702_c0_g1_i2.p1 TRINITY_DN4702_c0_g1~~TRINITY_DN4702_c0_g1_i2.p1  ORF type:complete len:414 (-),score=89.49 TRINITY_DN4702_c0_g1_i2:23-1264(-)
MDSQDKVFDEIQYFQFFTACFEGNVEHVENVLNEYFYVIDINRFDVYGNTPLHLAIFGGHVEVVKLLLGHPDINVNLKNAQMWSPFSEAVASRNKDIVLLIGDKMQTRAREQLGIRIGASVGVLEELPDFSLEISWNVKTWIPGVSGFFPNDIYYVCKMGSKIRVDSTIVGMEGIKFKRGDLSIIFDAEEKHLHILRRDKEEGSDLMAFLDTEIVHSVPEEQLQEILSEDVQRIGPDLSSGIELKESKGWFGGHKTSTVNGYNCVQYDAEGIKVEYTSRKFDADTFSSGEPTLSYLEYMEIFKDKPFIHTWETTNAMRKGFTGTVHLTDEFPITSTQLLPIIEAICPSNRKFEYIKDIIEALPEGKFPAKLEIPLIPTVSVTVAFGNFKEITPDPQMFEIPSWYFNQKETQSS